MEEISIKGKVFTKEEVCDYGKKSIAKTRKILMIIGIALLAACICFNVLYILLASTGSLVDSETGEITTVDDVIEIIPVFVIMLGIPGAVLLILSFIKAKKDPYATGVDFLNNHFPYPVGFDGKITPSLKGDKTIKLSENPVTKLIILSSEYKFQIVQNNKYSKIFTGKDVIEYEIKVDNEVVITSKTESKKGVGKALVGGALFGDAGMIAGAVAGNNKSTTSQSQKEIHHYTLALKVNDILKPSFVIELVSLQIAEEVAATFAIICQADNQAKADDELVAEPKFDKEEQKPDKFEEIKKYKELLDVGIISQEEFEIKKKEILG